MDLTTTLIFAAAGILSGLAARVAFLNMPDRWLLDYDETEAPKGFAQMRAFPFIYQGLLFTLLSMLLYARIPTVSVGGWQIASAMIAVPILLLILVADWKTRIIPDQLTIFLIVPGLLGIIGRLKAGEPLLKAAGQALLAALIAGGALLLIGLLGQFIMKREAMGMGDVKMIAAAAFLTGLANLPSLVLLSFLTAALIAVPLMVRRMIRSARSAHQNNPDATQSTSDETVIEHSVSNPSETLEIETPELDSEEDTAIAFGPFIAISALLLILFHSQIGQLASAYWSLFLR